MVEENKEEQTLTEKISVKNKLILELETENAELKRKLQASDNELKNAEDEVDNEDY